MTAKELIDYLSNLDPESNVSIVAVNRKRKVGYKGDHVMFITDETEPEPDITLVIDIETPLREKEEE